VKKSVSFDYAPPEMSEGKERKGRAPTIMLAEAQNGIARGFPMEETIPQSNVKSERPSPWL
jgi:hypothetical protein